MAKDIVELLQQEANARQALHENHASCRPWSDNYEMVGLVGEWEFSRVFMQPMDLTRRSKGDGGVDFVVPLRFTVDVKCARKATFLIKEEGTVRADIYVLAEFNDETKQATLVGWEWGHVLRKAPTRDFGAGIATHYIARESLRDITELKDKIMRLV